MSTSADRNISVPSWVNFESARWVNIQSAPTSLAQSVIEKVRGQHDEFVFVWRRERVKNLDQAPLMAYRPIETMNNTAWQRGRRQAVLGDLHVHDLRHTVGMRLREAGVQESTVADILWHSTQSMTHHYSTAQVVELHGALEKIKADDGQWNKSLATLKMEQKAMRGRPESPKCPPGKKNGLERLVSKPLIYLRKVGAAGRN